jgi:uncharacterized membrane protein
VDYSFCAPVFVFLSGLSIYLSAQRKTKKELSLFLLKRGLWLIFAEIVLITLGWTFNPLYNFIGLQVIWVIGCSMVIFSVLLFTSYRLILLAGLLLVFCHNISNYLSTSKQGVEGFLTNLFLTSRFEVYQYAPGYFIGIVYALLPWTGVMLLGYCTGKLFQQELPTIKRQRLLYWGGFASIALFVLLRYLNIYGDYAPWQLQNSMLYSLLSFINVSKYPPSLLYILITIGPALLLLAYLEKRTIVFANIFRMFGSVPFFYYAAHIYLIHTICIIAFFASGNTTAQIVDANSPFLFRPANFGFSLSIVYLIWLLVVGLLYLPCKKYAAFKKGSKQWWVSYL